MLGCLSAENNSLEGIKGGSKEGLQGGKAIQAPVKESWLQEVPGQATPEVLTKDASPRSRPQAASIVLINEVQSSCSRKHLTQEGEATFAAAVTAISTAQS